MLGLLAAGLGVPARAADVEFVRVWPGWRDADSFVRISEYFTGHENNGRETVLRTQTGIRSGYYFMARIRNSGATLENAEVVLRLIAPDSPEPRVYTFPSAVANGEHIFQIGVTGTDWPEKKTHPVAWRLELRAADKQLLAESHSFLWEKPEK